MYVQLPTCENVFEPNTSFSIHYVPKYDKNDSLATVVLRKEWVILSAH
jgi:hypothetical protein